MNKRQKNPVLIELRGMGGTGGKEPRRLGVGVVRETGEERVGGGSLHWWKAGENSKRQAFVICYCLSFSQRNEPNNAF